MERKIWLVSNDWNPEFHFVVWGIHIAHQIVFMVRCAGMLEPMRWEVLTHHELPALVNVLGNRAGEFNDSIFSLGDFQHLQPESTGFFREADIVSGDIAEVVRI